MTDSETTIFFISNKPLCLRCGTTISRGSVHCLRCWHVIRGHKLHKIAENEEKKNKFRMLELYR